ncbi:hypothetical protein A2960_04665 [Candidatus Gottesmanbacteria bacterium RIFCSPLOWO2_01_FULL_39_12b]|uniref:Uncharacterized protein n=1 Tax=Candidatus Gottesmanbacteria bacterium RIFCSPLOWO2_01_FULL_39_12b TaxID=1798388 RepID=A0A1F6ANH8_9BACT|nr:MAG: hypothetical protein A2960_04665 [Candidatus Gottesmanbacteria bacterium RIFCSPLOWO2_01_FULL_39_12b]
MDFYRLLKVIFAILILITVGEITYYFYLSFTSKAETNMPIYGDTASSNLAIHSQRLKEIAEYRNSSGKKIYIVFETNTSIEEVYPGGKKQDGFSYPFAIRYNDQKDMLYLFSEEMLKKVKIIIVKGENSSFGTVTDLKSKDRVLIQAIQDHSISPTERIDNFAKELKNYYIYVYK